MIRGRHATRASAQEFSLRSDTAGVQTSEGNEAERVSHFLVIYEALACFISDPTAFLGWMRRPNPNPQFETNPPLDLIPYADTKKLLERRL